MLLYKETCQLFCKMTVSVAQEKKNIIGSNWNWNVSVESIEYLWLGTKMFLTNK